MTKNRNLNDFTELISICLIDGWIYDNGEPSEDSLLEWVKLGRVDRAFIRHGQILHLIRGKESIYRVRYGDAMYTVGHWSAWVDKASISPPQKRLHYDRME